MSIIDLWLSKQTILCSFATNFLMIHPEHASLYVVGGIVRDLLLGIDNTSKDIDLMVEQSTEEALVHSLESLRKKKKIRSFMKVGKSFPVFKIRFINYPWDIDLALARKEVSTGIGHRDFNIDAHNISAREDAARRDFTVNALFLRLYLTKNNLHWELIDLYGGLRDLKHMYLRTVGPPEERFFEDPLRMLRALRFVHQKGFSLDTELNAVIKSRALDWIPTVSNDRIQEEFIKTMAVDLKRAYTDYVQLNLLKSCFPNLLEYLPKDSDRIPENCTSKEGFAEELVFPSLLIPWVCERSFKPKEGTLKKIESVLREYHIPNPKKIRAILSIFCTLNTRFDTPYPLSLQEKCLESPYGPQIQALHRLFGSLISLVPLSQLQLNPPKISGSQFLDWGFEPKKGLEEIILKAREMQLAGVVDEDLILSKIGRAHV